MTSWTFTKAADRLERVAQQLISAGPTRCHVASHRRQRLDQREIGGIAQARLPRPAVLLQLQLAAARSAVRANL